MRPEVVSNEVTVPLHPGARKRYEEARVLDETTDAARQAPALVG